MLSIFFPALMAVVGYFCLSQFKKATYENACNIHKNINKKCNKPKMNY